MLNIEICPCQKCKIAKWCIIEQVKFQDYDQRNPINCCFRLEQYRRSQQKSRLNYKMKNWRARQIQVLQ